MYLRNRFLFLFLTLLSWVGSLCAEHTENEKQTAVSMRMIGHRVLLSTGDSTSRVLPIEQEGNSYRIRFSSPFAFSPGVLSEDIHNVMFQTETSFRYLVEVIDEQTEETVYSYQIGNPVPLDLIPCGSRDMPEGQFSLLITLFDQVEQAGSSAEPTVTGSPFTFLKNAGANNLVLGLLFIVPFFLAALWFYFFRPKPEQTLLPDPFILSIGSYQFDKKNNLLSLNGETEELTGKEADLLSLLYESANNTLEREQILNEVWGDNGDYIGRTLDVFISKLRKKLQSDPNVKITNIRGVGYKLVLNS